MKISPYKLYEMSNGDAQEYKRLMIEHGYAIPKSAKDYEEGWVKYFGNNSLPDVLRALADVLENEQILSSVLNPNNKT